MKAAQDVSCASRAALEKRLFGFVDRKSTRLKYSHDWRPFAVFCLQKKWLSRTPVARRQPRYGPLEAYIRMSQILSRRRQRQLKTTLFPYTTLFRSNSTERSS